MKKLITFTAQGVALCSIYKRLSALHGFSLSGKNIFNPMQRIGKLTTLLILAFALQSCEGKAQKTTENEIKEVSVSAFGGRSTIKSKTYIITKDSVLYELIAHDSTKNVKKSYANNVQDWDDLLKSIDLERFKNVEDGKSHQEYDGNDTEITITTQNDKFSKLNAEKNSSWDRIYRQLVRTYYK